VKAEKNIWPNLDKTDLLSGSRINLMKTIQNEYSAQAAFYGTALLLGLHPDLVVKWAEKIILK